MIIKKYNTEGKYPYFIVDNWYTPEEEEKIWKELSFYTDYETMPNAAEGLAAKDEEGNSKADCYRLYPDEVYTQKGRNTSYILRFQQPKIFSNKIKQAFQKTSPVYRNWQSCDKDNTIISYYENNHHYHSHYDSAQVTALIWLYIKPKAFSGGNLTFTDSNIKVRCRYNRMVMFPGFYEHQVDPITLKKKKAGLGRYCITHFYSNTR